MHHKLRNKSPDCVVDIIDVIIACSKVCKVLGNSLEDRGKDITEVFELEYLKKKLAPYTQEALRIAKDLEGLSNSIEALAKQGHDKLKLQRYKESLN